MRLALKTTLILPLLLTGLALLQAPAMANSEVTIYLHDGTDVTGTITQANTETLTVKTTKETVTIPRKQYQGMVLNTPQQKEMAHLITTDPIAMVSYGMYSQQAREKINFALKKSLQGNLCPVSKLQTSQPVAHIQINPKGVVQKTFLLSASTCDALNQALLKSLKTVKMGPFPKDYPFNMHVLNYFYMPLQTEN